MRYLRLGLKLLWAVLLLLAASPAPAAEANPVGVWECTAGTPDGQQVPWTLKISMENGKYVGVTNSHVGERPIQNARLDGDSLSFEVKRDEGSHRVKVKITGDRLEGTWTAGEMDFPVRGTRK